MWSPPPRLYLTCLVWVCLVWVHGPCMGKETLLTETLRKKLAVFATSSEAVASTKEQLVGLESESYAERRKAMAALVRANGLKDVLAKSKIDLTAEGRTALKIIGQAQADTGAEEKLRLLMRRVQSEKVIGLTHAILNAWEGRVATSSESNRLGREALRTTLQSTDLLRLKNGLKSLTPFVRELSLIGLQKLRAEKADIVDLLEPLLADAQDEVRLEAAVLGAFYEHRGSLASLASLLESETFHIRHQSHGLLTAMTEQDFGFYSDGNATDRKDAATLWKRWVAKFGKKASLRFGKVLHWIDEDETYE
ncbi:MAG: hypothetical protein ACI8T1_001335 [Verrucomicrobiales bacterium]|jgi:hypothetical protein